MGNFKDLTGQKFNRLTVLELSTRNNSGQIQWKCKCDCGNTILATTTYLKTGHTKSCGCLNKENASKRMSSKKFQKARDNYRKNNFLKEGTSLSLINPKKIRKNNNTGVTGVSYYSNIKRYVARIFVKGQNISLGTFKDLESAKKARKQAEEKYFKPILDKYNKNI